MQPGTSEAEWLSASLIPAATVGLRPAADRSKLDAVVLASIAGIGIPVAILTPVGTDREASEDRAVIAHEVFRDRHAVATVPPADVADAQAAPGQIRERAILRTNEEGALSNCTQLAGTSEPEPSTRIAALSPADDCRPTLTLPRWSLFTNQ